MLAGVPLFDVHSNLYSDKSQSSHFLDSSDIPSDKAYYILRMNL